MASAKNIVWSLLLLLAFLDRSKALVSNGRAVRVCSTFSTKSNLWTSVSALPQHRQRQRPRQQKKGQRIASCISLHMTALNDQSWEEIAKTMESASKTVQLSSIYRAGGSIRWNTLFTNDDNEWFAAVSLVLQDCTKYYTQLPIVTEALVVLLPLLMVTAIVTLYSISFPPTGYRNGKEPYNRGNYDPIQARAYYSSLDGKLLVLQRLLQALRLSNKFIINILIDKYVPWRDEEAQRSKRANDLLDLVTKLGPTAIKVGQLLSVRVDLIDKEYARALATLQDSVPPFDAVEAREILLRELGTERLLQLNDMMGTTTHPVASASIGQVYRTFIGDHKEVAVKVQRPNILAEIALDLHIVREFAPIFQKITGTASDLQALANEWGRGFIQELDYNKEAESTTRFTEEMKKRNLNTVCAPTVVSEYSTQQVLVTEWVDGTRLDESDAADVSRLCSVALNAYLVMLLETQTLHCDPHPGNLLRTTDGKLCILDHGMVLSVDTDLQFSLLEFCAHLTSEDYEQLPEDFVKLGFLKEEKLDFVRRNGVFDPLKYFFQQITKGGGARMVRNRVFDEYREKYPGMSDDELRTEMLAARKEELAEAVERESTSTGITIEVEELQRQNRDSFRIPEWFLYTSRAFLTLEGVSLQANENYSIIKSCFPYVAKRLVEDDSPRATKALRDLLYGAGDAISVERISDLADGFTSYTASTKTINQQAKAFDAQLTPTDQQAEGIDMSIERKNRIVQAEAAITIAKDSADILLSAKGNLVQNILVQESALAASARFKDSFRNTFVIRPKNIRDALPFGAGAFIPPLPFEHQIEPFVRKNEKEIKAQELAKKLISFIPSQLESVDKATTSSNNSDGDDSDATQAMIQSFREMDPEQAALVLRELRLNVPKYAPLLAQLGGKFVSTLLSTASFNIEATLAELEMAGKDVDSVTMATVKRISLVAERGATAALPLSEANTGMTSENVPSLMAIKK